MSNNHKWKCYLSKWEAIFCIVMLLSCKPKLSENKILITTGWQKMCLSKNITYRMGYAKCVGKKYQRVINVIQPSFQNFAIMMYKMINKNLPDISFCTMTKIKTEQKKDNMYFQNCEAISGGGVAQ